MRTDSSPPRLSVLALCFHQHSELFTVRVISRDPEALRALPQLATPQGMAWDRLTAEELQEHLQVAPDVVAIAQRSPGTWYSLPGRRFLEPEEARALADETEGGRDAA
jgi:hypothetical protein